MNVLALRSTTGHVLVGASIALTCGVGCGTSRELSGGMRAYEIGNFHQAAESCEDVDAQSLDDRHQVRYYVYCGLAYYHLGDQTSAGRMLAAGRERYENGDPRWLKPIIVDQMNKALGAISGPSIAPVTYAPAADTPVVGLRTTATHPQE